MPDLLPESPITWSDATRALAFQRWVHAITPTFGLKVSTLRPASADASFRRYFRLEGQVRGQACNFIVMDAPPPQEDVRPFVKVAGLIHDAGLNGPRVLAQDGDHGFLLLQDLGTELYLDALQKGDADTRNRLMHDAFSALIQWQLKVPATALPPYDASVLERELDLFPTWCVEKEFGQTWDAKQQGYWQHIRQVLVNNALAQPVVAVHRDWMPRNLMMSDPNPGILDFQDALAGPITYDFASLLRDAFISWEEEQEIDWAVRGWDAARKAGLPVNEDFGDFWRQLEWMGLQRHLKVLGIFCRLKHRDGKPAYSEDLPRFFHYATKVAMRYRELSPLLRLLEPLSGARVSAGFTF